MSLDNKAIETLSVSAVKNSIITSEFLDSYISDNDKEPSWDGNVYIYKDKSKKKESLLGRMPVQVKGKESNVLSESEISYSMKIVDLRNYLNDGGCVLFVVYIDNNGESTKIYYNELTPIKLRKILKEKKKKKSKTVYLKEFPNNSNEKATIFLNCLQNCKKQVSFNEQELLNLEDLQKSDVLEEIVIPFSGVGYNDALEALISNENYIYAKIKNSSFLHPIDIIPKNLQTSKVIDTEITINDKIFYKQCNIIKSSEKTILCFGSSFKITLNENGEPYKFNYSNSDKIRILAKDLDFVLRCIDAGYFKVNGIKLPFNFDKEYKNFEKEKQKENLAFAKNVVEVLDMLNCSEDISIKDMGKGDWDNLKYLMIAFFEKKPVTGLQEDLPKIGEIKVGKLRFIVYLKQCQEKGTYEIFDYFNIDLSVPFKNYERSEEVIDISQYIFLNENYFLTLSNIDFNKLLPSFKNSESNEGAFSGGNYFLLELLKAYDKAKGNRKEKLLETCKNFSTWILEAPEKEVEYQVKILNSLQTIKRYRKFSKEEIEKLYSIVENKDSDESCVVGAYLLLDQQLAAEIHFARLNDEEQKIFKEYPIYTFWKNLKE